MKNLYGEKDYEKALKLKKKLLAIYLAALAAVVVVCGVIFTLYMFLPYPSTEEVAAKKSLYLFLDCLIASVFAIASVVYLSIPYKRAKYYFEMLDDIKTGQKQKSESTFLQNDLAVTNVRNVDFRTMVVLEWSEKTQEFMRRNVLVDKEKEMPELKNGDIIVYITHANVLLSYGLKSDEEVFEELNDKN
ncbi:MAG: hypothetical protein IJS67_05555 [Clostridia bacterium]|nr:hypothetical protein [Clostridia bacterium]